MSQVLAVLAAMLVLARMVEQLIKAGRANGSRAGWPLLVMLLGPVLGAVAACTQG